MPVWLQILAAVVGIGLAIFNVTVQLIDKPHVRGTLSRPLGVGLLAWIYVALSAAALVVMINGNTTLGGVIYAAAFLVQLLWFTLQPGPASHLDTGLLVGAGLTALFLCTGTMLERVVTILGNNTKHIGQIIDIDSVQTATLDSLVHRTPKK